MSYIVAKDITDRVIKALINNMQFDLYAYLAEADSALVDLAYKSGVSSTSSLDTDDDGRHNSYIVQRYLICMVCFRVCEDCAGLNNLDNLEDDKYFSKMEHYKKRMAEYESQITYEVLTGTENERIDFIQSAYALRG